MVNVPEHRYRHVCDLALGCLQAPLGHCPTPCPVFQPPKPRMLRTMCLQLCVCACAFASPVHGMRGCPGKCLCNFSELSSNVISSGETCPTPGGTQCLSLKLPWRPVHLYLSRDRTTQKLTVFFTTECVVNAKYMSNEWISKCEIKVPLFQCHVGSLLWLNT